jgi:hypothetical protein
MEEFTLVQPVPGISLGDDVRVRFRDENGRHLALSIEEVADAPVASASTQRQYSAGVHSAQS